MDYYNIRVPKGKKKITMKKRELWFTNLWRGERDRDRDPRPSGVSRPYRVSHAPLPLPSHTSNRSQSRLTCSFGGDVEGRNVLTNNCTLITVKLTVYHFVRSFCCSAFFFFSPRRTTRLLDF